MSDDLTRAVAEALGCEERIGHGGEHYCRTHNLGRDTGWPCGEAETVAAALAPLIEARVREARTEALTDAADAWTQGARAAWLTGWPASQYAGDWLRERAEEVRDA